MAVDSGDLLHSTGFEGYLKASGQPFQSLVEKCECRKQRNPQEEDDQARGAKKKAMCAKQSPSSDAEPPLKHQVIHRKNIMLMQGINSMDKDRTQQHGFKQQSTRPTPQSGRNLAVLTQSYAGFVDHFKEVFGKPFWDSSVGEELCRLQQGKLTVPVYVLQFRTLAAKSGGNEQALLAAYRQGLNPQVRLHLAAYEEAIGLERLIQLSIHVAARMQSYVDEPQDQSSHNTWRDRPAPVSSPEPDLEPMHLGTFHLTPAERQRRLTQNLCLYCGAPGHAIPACPIHPPCSMVSTIFPVLPKMRPLTTHGTLTTSHASVSVVALLDSGSAGNFISGTLCRQLGLRTKATATPYQIQSITGKPVSHRQVSRSAGPVLLQGTQNPILSWSTGEVLKWGDTCFPDCFPDLPALHSLLPTPLPVQATSIESPFVNQPLEVPTCYAPFSDVFCPKRVSKLPPHRPWDCAIDLLPGEPVPRGRIYPLSILEEKAMEEYRRRPCTQGYIRPSTSPAASSFFFVAKKDGGLRPCIDYCALNHITVKFSGPRTPPRCQYLPQVGPPQRVQPHPDTRVG
ncbi:hypothetical protein QTP70_001463 [Hemibagrus guttatus]|uniref:Retrotransposon gag domain-containing protein n=1 Tax=Hemibagrus guttatus TaxID=175788 RepID=A0AAE0R5U6_9TELE|nr:hypothetical protein QTP70_001463 [Hemibagrus guttatus]